MGTNIPALSHPMPVERPAVPAGAGGQGALIAGLIRQVIGRADKAEAKALIPGGQGRSKRLAEQPERHERQQQSRAQD